MRKVEVVGEVAFGCFGAHGAAATEGKRPADANRVRHLLLRQSQVIDSKGH